MTNNDTRRDAVRAVRTVIGAQGFTPALVGLVTGLGMHAEVADLALAAAAAGHAPKAPTRTRKKVTA